MSNHKPTWDVLSEAQRKICLDNIISFFTYEREEEIGIIAATEIMELVMEDTFAAAYNKGVQDCKETLTEKLTDLQIDLDMLKK